MLSLKSYNKIWEVVISNLIDFYQEKNSFLELRIPKDELRDVIWDNYQDFNKQCREYMNDDLDNLDRHKVVACYIYAVVKSDPFKYNNISADCLCVASEQLALSVGLELFRCFLISKSGRNNSLKDHNEYNKDKNIFRDGLLFPEQDEIGHGEYRSNFAIELYYTKINKNYNVLSLSHILYMLELYNRQRYELVEGKK